MTATIHTPPIRDAEGNLLASGTDIAVRVYSLDWTLRYTALLPTDGDSRLLIESEALGGNGDDVRVLYFLSDRHNVVGRAVVTADEDPGNGDGDELPALNPERGFGEQTLMSGASWMNNGMPVWYDNMVEAAAGTSTPSTIISLINGSTWTYRWNHDWTEEPWPSAREILESGSPDVDIFVVSDISSMMPTQSVIDYGTLWVNLAHASNTECFFYALHGRNSYTGVDNAGFADWNADNDMRIENWEAVYNAVSAAKNPGAPSIKMIPVGVIYKRIYDEIIAGDSPSDFNEMYVLFGDTHETLGDAHPSYIGRFIIALAHYATIYRRSPVGLPSYSALTGRDEIWSPSTLEWVQTLVWEVVRDYQYSGVRQFIVDPDWVITTVFDELTVHVSPTEGATSHALRLVGETDPLNYVTLEGAIPKTFTGLAAGDYEVSENETDWSHVVSVAGVVQSDIVIDSTVQYQKPGNPLTSEGPNSADVVSGDGIDVDISPSGVIDGDRILFLGVNRSSNSSLKYGANLAPETYFTTNYSVSRSAPEGFAGATVSICASTGLKSESVPNLFSNINRFSGGFGFAFVVKASSGIIFSDLNASDDVVEEVAVNTIDLPEMTNIPTGAKVINVVQIGNGSRLVVEPDGVETLVNGVNPDGANSIYMGVETAYGGTLPSRAVSMNGAAAPMRALRVVILPEGT